MPGRDCRHDSISCSTCADRADWHRMGQQREHLDPHRAVSVSWDEFHRHTRVLARLLAEIPPFMAIVAISRGGLVPAAILARELGIRVVETVCVASYEHVTQGDVRLLKPVAAEIAML